MANLRILYQNEVDTSTVTTNLTAGTLVATNLKTDIKSQVWRSTGTTGTITATWATAKTITCVALPFTNFTNAATMRVVGFNGATQIFDTGVLSCCFYTSSDIFGWTNNAPGVNNFGFGGGVYASLFFTGGTNITSIVIYLSDSTNPSGYIECSRLLAGNYFEPNITADNGAQIGWTDASSHVRSDAGDLITDTRTRSKTLTFNFSNASATDRESLMKIMRLGIANPLYISVFPSFTNKNLEQDYQIWGKLSQQSIISITRYLTYSTGITIDEI